MASNKISAVGNTETLSVSKQSSAKAWYCLQTVQEEGVNGEPGSVWQSVSKMFDRKPVNEGLTHHLRCIGEEKSQLVHFHTHFFTVKLVIFYF